MQDNKIQKSLNGVIVPTLTYFEEDGTIREDVNRLQLIHCVEHGADVLFLLGSTGEGTFFKDMGEKGLKEQIKYIFIAIDVVVSYMIKDNKRIPLLIGVYGEDSGEVLEEIRKLKEAMVGWFNEHIAEYAYIPKYLRSLKGAEDNKGGEILMQFVDGLVIPPPRKRKLDQVELINFYSKILENISIPIYLYNNPSTFGNNIISKEVLMNLLKFPNLFGIKDSSSTLEQKKEYLELLSKKENFSVSCGKEGMIGDFMMQISDRELRIRCAVVPSLSNMTNNAKKIYNAAINMEDDKVLAEQNEMNSFRNKLYDAEESKGKAQRGLKIAFKVLYEDLIQDIPTNVRPEFKRVLSEEKITEIKNTLNYCLSKGYTRKIAEHTIKK
ncbi:MAG: dihydrodipicolinate synthase family protein [Promethearchaeota archaeon]